MSRLIVLDDACGHFGPLRDFRPIFDQRSGAQTTLERLQQQCEQSVDALIVPAELLALTQEQHPDTSVNDAGREEDEASVLVINGRYAGVICFEDVTKLAPGQKLVQPDGQIVAMHVKDLTMPKLIAQLASVQRDDLADALQPVMLEQPVLYERPWDFLSQLEVTMQHDLSVSKLPDCDAAEAATRGITLVELAGQQNTHTLHIAPSARVLPGVVINLERGSVVIDEHAIIQPLAYLEGPCYVGRETIVSAHAHVRPCTSIGPMCKIGGEISHSIIHGCTNKAHSGYLGNAIVGQWCNLGANTNVSNLKNTYGNIRINLEPTDQPAEDTGSNHLGPILGDFVRTGIGTHILTGYVIHSGCMIAGLSYAPKQTQPLGFYTPDPNVTIHQLEPMLTTFRRMLARRGRDLSPALEQRLREMYEQASLSSD